VYSALWAVPADRADTGEAETTRPQGLARQDADIAVLKYPHWHGRDYDRVTPSKVFPDWPHRFHLSRHLRLDDPHPTGMFLHC